MTIKEILRRKGGRTVVIGMDQTVHAAITTLNANRIGAVVVVDADGRIAGILSERDILRECGIRCDRAAGGSLEAVGPALVRDVMTRDVITGAVDDDLTAVMSVMTENRIRHLPIVDDGALVGMISIGDAVKACVEIAEAENRHLREYIEGAGH